MCKCVKRRCRHCCYGHLRITPTARTPRINRITRPTLLPWCDHPIPLASHAQHVALLWLCVGVSSDEVAARVQALRGGEDISRAEVATGCPSCIGLAGAFWRPDLCFIMHVLWEAQRSAGLSELHV